MSLRPTQQQHTPLLTFNLHHAASTGVADGKRVKTSGELKVMQFLGESDFNKGVLFKHVAKMHPKIRRIREPPIYRPLMPMDDMQGEFTRSITEAMDDVGPFEVLFSTNAVAFSIHEDKFHVVLLDTSVTQQPRREIAKWVFKGDVNFEMAFDQVCHDLSDM